MSTGVVLVMAPELGLVLVLEHRFHQVPHNLLVLFRINLHH